MSSYLDLAEKVLRQERRPLSARAIMRQGYLNDLIPTRLYGETQHKTLQARLSEDILENRKRSRFFRTAPGIFFLRELISDHTLPKEFRIEVFAKRRTRSLHNKPVLRLFNSFIAKAIGKDRRVNADLLISEAKRSGNYTFDDLKSSNETTTPVWVVTTVRRGTEILSYKSGIYRTEDASFAKKRSVAFSSLVTEDNQTLFDTSHLGISESGLSAVSSDLNVPVEYVGSNSCEFHHRLKCILVFGSGSDMELIAHLELEAPEWFEPIRGSLSINDLRWTSLATPPNNIDDFDPWSRSILCGYFSKSAAALN